MSNSLTTSDIQFLGNDPTTQKLRRLVQDLVAAEKAINTLINEVTTLQSEAGSTGTEVLATTEELGPNFTVSGLTEGQVLKALSATSAAFAKLSLSDLSNVLIENGQNGQVLTFINNQWVNSSPDAGPSAPQGQNQGTGIDVYAGLSGGNLVFNSIAGDGSSISVDIVGETIVVSFIGTAGGNGVVGGPGPPGFDEDPEPGEPGPPGQIGPQGIQGVPGATGGTTVFQYLMVESPDAGEPGDFGPPGIQGIQGIQGPSGSGGSGSTFILMDADAGADGDPGPPGFQGIAGTGGSTVGVPATINDLVWWWQGDIALVSAGTGLQRMFDSGPWTGNHANTSAPGVVRDATQLNGRNVFTWPASTAGRWTLSTGISLPSATVFAVIKPNYNATYTGIMFSGGSASLEYTQDRSNGKMAFVKNSASIIGESTTALTNGTWYQVNATYNGITGNYAFRTARAADGSGTNLQAITAQTTAFGYNPQSGSEDMQGDLAEFIVYQRVLSGAEISAVEAYLLAKWGV
jgi:hypothetical protein